MGVTPDWAAVAHRAVVSRHVWRQRVARGWDVETALTTPFVERRDLRTRVREILAQQPDATPQDVARLLGEIGTAHAQRVMESIGRAPQKAEPPLVWVHPIRRRLLGLPVAATSYRQQGAR